MSSCPFPGLAKYKDIFGKPGSTAGLRKYRIFGIALLDVIVVLMFAYLFSIFNGYPFITNALGLFILGIIAHRMFCVRTAVDKILFPRMGTYGSHR
jgi:hypothetical protein